MSAPKYSSSNYDSAAARYQQLADKYSGENAYKYADTAARQAQVQAKEAAESEGAAAQNLARNAGYSRAKAAQAGAAARASSYKNNYSNSYANTLSNIQTANSNALNAQQALLQGASQKDSNKYQSNSNRYGAAMGAVGGVFTGAANALSDESKKVIYAKTDCDKRREELLSRLKGGK